LSDANLKQYGGYWVPAASAYFHRQIEQLQITDPYSALSKFKVDTIGITNGCIDLLVSIPSYPEYTCNNTYGIELVTEDTYASAMHNFTKPGGCRDLIEQCRALGDIGDPDNVGSNSTVNEACQLATSFCFAYVIGDLSTVGVRISLILSGTVTLTIGTEIQFRHSGTNSRLLPSLYASFILLQSTLGTISARCTS
jgi:hypothetical protein